MKLMYRISCIIPVSAGRFNDAMAFFPTLSLYIWWQCGMSSAMSFREVPGGKFRQTTPVEIVRLFLKTASLIDEATIIRKD